MPYPYLYSVSPKTLHKRAPTKGVTVKPAYWTAVIRAMYVVRSLCDVVCATYALQKQVLSELVVEEKIIII